MTNLATRALLLMATCTLAACSAQRTLYTPTAEERALLAQPPLGLRVVVAHWRSGTTGQSPFAYSSSLANLLEASKTFSSAIYDSTRRAPADLIATPTHDYCNTAVIPLLTIFTLGVVPTIWTEVECTGVVFHSARDSSNTGDSVVVRMNLGGKAVMGLLAAPIGLLPGWSWHEGREQRAYQQALRLRILEHRNELLALVRTPVT